VTSTARLTLHRQHVRPRLPPERCVALRRVRRYLFVPGLLTVPTSSRLPTGPAAVPLLYVP
jgi:hypothetical protein